MRTENDSHIPKIPSLFYPADPAARVRFFVIFLFSLFFTSCGLFVDYGYLYPPSNVSITELSFFHDTRNSFQTYGIDEKKIMKGYELFYRLHIISPGDPDDRKANIIASTQADAESYFTDRLLLDFTSNSYATKGTYRRLVSEDPAKLDRRPIFNINEADLDKSFNIRVVLSSGENLGSELVYFLDNTEFKREEMRRYVTLSGNTGAVELLDFDNFDSSHFDVPSDYDSGFDSIFVTFFAASFGIVESGELIFSNVVFIGYDDIL